MEVESLMRGNFPNELFYFINQFSFGKFIRGFCYQGLFGVVADVSLNILRNK